MNIKVTGTHRSAEVTLEQLEKHKETIEHWVEGGEVEVLTSSHEWELSEQPSFYSMHEYRPLVNPVPKQGEVWKSEGTTFIVSEYDKFFNIAESSMWDDHDIDFDDLVFVADSIESYYQ